MDKQAPEYKRAREQIACAGCSSNGKGCCIVGKPLTDGFCGKQLEKADSILSIKSIAIEKDDQSLPIPSLGISTIEHNAMTTMQKANFRRVI